VPQHSVLGQSFCKLNVLIQVDLTNDELVQLPAPLGWGIHRRYGRLFIRAPSGTVCQLKSSQFIMLEQSHHGPACDTRKTEILEALVTSCKAQTDAVARYHVHGSRYFLASVARITSSRRLVGSLLATFHPHFSWFASPCCQWPELSLVEKAVGVSPRTLCVDTKRIAPFERESSHMLREAFDHSALTWILRLVPPSRDTEHDQQTQMRRRAQRFVYLRKGALVMQTQKCWSICFKTKQAFNKEVTKKYDGRKYKYIHAHFRCCP
jgi:hypothetical protein